MSGIPSIRYDLTRVWTTAEYNAAGPRTVEDKPPLGAIVIEPETGKEYIFVHNVDATAQQVGSVVCWSYATTLLPYEVDQLGGTGTHINSMAGVCMSAPAASGYGWIQSYGENASIFMDGTTDTVLGDSLKAVSGQKHVVKDAAGGTEPTYARHIMCLEAYVTAADALKKGFIRCR